MLMAYLLLVVLVFIFYEAPIFVIAYKSEHPYSWLAFVPFANTWLMCDMADLDLSDSFNPLFYIIVWMRLAENANKPSWLGILMILPLVDWVIGYYIAFVPS